MSLCAAEIGRVVERLNAALQRAVVRQIHTPAAPERIVLELRLPGANELLQIVLSSGATRIGRIDAVPTRAPAPHPFAMLLRRRARGMAVQAVRQIEGDRAVALDLARGDDSGTLIAELTARHGNLFWIDAAGQIVGSYHVNRSHKRRLVPGQPYQPLLPGPDAPPRPPRFDRGADLEQRIEQHYRALERSRELEHQRAVVARLARAARRRLKRLTVNLAADRKRADEAELLQQRAHLLQANLPRARRGQTEVEVADFTGQPVRIPLDPRLDPVANMSRLFERAKRLRRATPRIEERTAETARAAATVAALSDEIPAASPDRLDAISDELAARFPGLVQRVRERGGGAPARLPYKEFAIAAGRTARVGRSSADNDALTLRFARPDDLWLHVRGRAGSHVVVPLGRGEDPTSELLVDAAHLAVHYSTARDDDDVEVTYTRRRYVQKPRGAPAGSVRLLKEKTLLLRVDRERLAELLATPQ